MLDSCFVSWYSDIVVRVCTDPSRREKIAFPFVPLEYTRNIPVIGILIVWVAVDIVGLFRRKNILRTDYMSHLGGYAAGIMAGESLKQRAGLHRLSGRERQKHSSLMDDPSQGRI